MWRLTPFVQKSENRSVFLCADRVGFEQIGENKVYYAGTSCALYVKELKLVNWLDKKKEDFLMVEIQI
jgi:hypothetical protein